MYHPGGPTKPSPITLLLIVYREKTAKTDVSSHSYKNVCAFLLKLNNLALT